MRILQLTLSKYKGLALSNIQTIKLNFMSDLTLILGSNGSGKSSLLREISPLPAIAGDYHEGGYKSIELVHNAVGYTLRSEIKRTAKHSFKREDEELNTGGTASVQRDLVDQHLGYTPVIHRLLLGQFHFTEASLQERRDILTSVSALNLKYAQSMFDKMRIANRDKVGALKHLSQKETALETDLLSMGEISKLGEESKQIQVEIRQLIPLSINTDPMQDALRGNLVESIEVLDGLIENYQRQAVSVGNHGFTSFSSLICEIESTDKSLHVCRSDIARLVSELDNLTVLTQVIEASVDGIDVLEQRLVDAIAIRDKITIPQGIEYGSALKEVLHDLQSSSKALYETYTSIRSDCIPCGRELLKTHKANMDEKRVLEGKIESGIRRLEAHIEHSKLANASAVSCPNCNVVINKDRLVDAETITLYEDRLERGRVKLKVVQGEIHELSELLEREHAFWTYVDEYGAVMRHYPRLSPYWGSLPSLRKAAEHANITDTDLHKEINRVGQHLEYNELTESINKLTETIELHKLAGESNACHRKLKVESDMMSCYSAEGKLVEHASRLLRVEKHYLVLKRVHESCEVALDAISDAMADYLNAVAYTEVGKLLTGLQARLTTIQGTLNRRDHLTASLASIKSDSVILRNEERALAAMIKGLSPKEGLIAEQMCGVVNGYMKQVNQVIREVWEYPLSVGECGMEDKGLDYKFPLLVDESVVPELSDGSKGQKAMINLAFIIVVMGYLGLEEYPLFMDEVGSSFDTAHQANLIEYIKLLVGVGHCEQLFMVNHYSELYGGLNNADIVVLSENNIMLPDRYNDHVEITYS